MVDKDKKCLGINCQATTNNPTHSAECFTQALPAIEASKQEAQPCRLCGAAEAFSGGCGGGRSNPNALCFEGKQEAQGGQVEKRESPTCPQEIINALSAYGDARADLQAGAKVDTAKPLADCIKLIRSAIAAATPATPAQAEPDYDALEREHMGDYKKKTGIYAPKPELVALTPVPLDTIREWAKRRASALGPEGVTDPVAFLEEGVRWREALANRPPACDSCNGKGVDGDVGRDGQAIDVPCGNCDGTGHTAPTSERQAKIAEEQQAFEAECLRLFGDLAYFDRDQYGNYKNIVVRAKFDGWMLARSAPASERPRCRNCDDTGDVHSIDGEWRGRCHCPVGRCATQPAPIDRDALTDLIAQHLSGTYHCTRTWQAWGVGTMSQDDFADVGESDTPGELADAILAAMAAPIEIVWPTSRDVGRSGDMTPAGQSVLRVTLDTDNDVCIEMWDRGRHINEYQRVGMEFCNGGGGGGKSPRTRAALINLMTAIEQDNAADPTKGWRVSTTGEKERS